MSFPSYRVSSCQTWADYDRRSKGAAYNYQALEQIYVDLLTAHNRTVAVVDNNTLISP